MKVIHKREQTKKKKRFGSLENKCFGGTSFLKHSVDNRRLAGFLKHVDIYT